MKMEAWFRIVGPALINVVTEPTAMAQTVRFASPDVS
jgi:hypothetical protein